MEHAALAREREVRIEMVIREVRELILGKLTDTPGGHFHAQAVIEEVFARHRMPKPEIVFEGANVGVRIPPWNPRVWSTWTVRYPS